MEGSPLLRLALLQTVALRGLSAQELAWGRRLAPALQERYWRSRAALRLLLARRFGCEPAAVALHSPPGQAPRLLEGRGWVSLSHSGPMLLAAWSPWPVGVDLEPAGRPLAASALARRFFPPAEWHQLQGLPPERLRRAVLASWLLKEAAIKWGRRSLARDLAHWRFDHGQGLLQHGRDGLALPWCLGEQQAPAGPGGSEASRWRWALVGQGAARARVLDGPGSDLLD